MPQIEFIAKPKAHDCGLCSWVVCMQHVCMYVCPSHFCTFALTSRSHADERIRLDIVGNKVCIGQVLSGSII